MARDLAGFGIVARQFPLALQFLQNNGDHIGNLAAAGVGQHQGVQARIEIGNRKAGGRGRVPARSVDAAEELGLGLTRSGF